MIIDFVKNETKNYTFSIKDKFKIDMNDCPIVSYSIKKVIDKNTKQPIALSDCIKLFNVDSKGVFSVLPSD